MGAVLGLDILKLMSRGAGSRAVSEATPGLSSRPCILFSDPACQEQRKEASLGAFNLPPSCLWDRS